ncbi:hypothetical protein Glove_54g75 [Diversispora epigaea]|uniref:Iodothyronine deiodinase n=1 Tax=Diversispora epigaea TaxID=1348612 RepID=A0A397JMN0_9GLOM|nr:hypothetical protein Glove_54g75 [Diversispora epigaea]
MLYFVLKLRGDMFQETSGHQDFNELPSLTQSEETSVEAKDISINTVITSPKLPTTKEELLTLLYKEERRRLSPEIQEQYYKHDLVREFDYSDEAVQILRCTPQLYPEEMSTSDYQLILLESSQDKIGYDKAHASDVWPIGNVVSVKEHLTIKDRLTAAREIVTATQLEIPVLVDTMDNNFLNLYSPWPFRFFVVIDDILKLVRMPKKARYNTTDLVKCLDNLLDGNK